MGWLLLLAFLGLALCVLLMILSARWRMNAPNWRRTEGEPRGPRITSPLMTYRNGLTRTFEYRVTQRAWDILTIRRKETLLDKEEIIDQAYAEIIQEEALRLNSTQNSSTKTGP